MPAPSHYNEFRKTQTNAELLNSALERMKEMKNALSFTILRNNVALKEHTSKTNEDCIGPNGTQTGVEVEFILNDHTEKILVCNHCYKSGLSEQK